MAYLVSGATGFIGTNLCLKLLKSDKTVIGIDNFITSTKDNLKKLLKYDNFIFLEDNIENPKLKNRLSKISIDIIYHFACPTGVPNTIKIPEKIISANSFGIKNMLEIAKEKNAIFFFASSSEIYGFLNDSPINEKKTGNINPLSWRASYSESKRFAENYIYIFSKKHNLKSKIIRIFNTYGPNYSKTDSRVIPSFLSKALQNQDLLIYGDGNQIRTFLYIDDLIEGISLVNEKGVSEEAYNVGYPQEISILELANLIIKLTKSTSKISFIKNPFDECTCRIPSIEKIQKIGWSPKFSLVDGLQKTLKNITK